MSRCIPLRLGGRERLPCVLGFSWGRSLRCKWTNMQAPSGLAVSCSGFELGFSTPCEDEPIVREATATSQPFPHMYESGTHFAIRNTSKYRRPSSRHPRQTHPPREIPPATTHHRTHRSITPKTPGTRKRGKPALATSEKPRLYHIGEVICRGRQSGEGPRPKILREQGVLDPPARGSPAA